MFLRSNGFTHKATVWIQVFFFTQIKSENWQCRHPSHLKLDNHLEKTHICHKTEMSKCLVWVTNKKYSSYATIHCIQTAKFTLLPKIIFPGRPLPPFRRTSQRRPAWICLIRWWDIKWCQMWKLHIKWNPSRWIVSLQLSTQITSPKKQTCKHGKEKNIH